ncbi:MAG TPA: hypothetical protein VGF79_08330 [Bacteroidia bacterium]
MKTALFIFFFSFVNLYGLHENVLVPIEKSAIPVYKRFNLSLNANNYIHIRTYLDIWIEELRTLKRKPKSEWAKDTLLYVLSNEIFVYSDSQWVADPQRLREKLLNIRKGKSYNETEKSILNWCFVSHHNPIQKNLWYLFPGVNFENSIEQSIIGIDTNWGLYGDSFVYRPIPHSEIKDSALFSQLYYRFGLEHYHPGSLIQAYSANRILTLLKPFQLNGDIDPRSIILYKMLEKAKKEEWVLIPVMYGRGT